MKSRTLILSVALLLGACATPEAHLFDGMGKHTRPAGTDSQLAQHYFNQGMAFAYGFDRDQAVRSFEAATKHDPSCAMAWWGMAMALGPDINVPMDAERGARAYAAVSRAMALRHQATEVHRELIEALSLRYDTPPPENRASLDRAYAGAMRDVWRRHPEDADVGTLFAEAMLDLRPWDQWTKDGNPQPGTEEIVQTLEHVLVLNPNHPGANHLYIHTIEASPQPEKALPAADRLAAGDDGRPLVPAIGHLIHMPAHIYVQTGRYADAVEANTKAVAVDRAYSKIVGPQGSFEFYHAHNHHFLAYAAMFDGQYDTALKAARELMDELPASALANPGVEEFTPTALHVYVRFGRWEEILKEPVPEKRHPYTHAMWHYARGVALANTNRIKEAQAEAKAFDKSVTAVPKELTIFVVPAHDVLRVARHMLAGEILFHDGHADTAFAELRKAVAAEDALRYAEPSPWMQPVRHALGALLLQAGLVAEAEATYRADLKRHPKNGWALHGLAECQNRLGATAAAADTRARFDKAWSRSDVKIKASCFCRTVK